MLAEGENVVMADEVKKEEKVVSREEKFKEIQNRRGQFHRKVAKKSAYGGNYNQPVAAEEVNDDNGKENFDKINGEKVLREYGPNGLRNAVHFLISKPQTTLFDFVLSLNVNPDQPDYDEITPFNLMSSNMFNMLDINHQHMLKKFL